MPGYSLFNTSSLSKMNASFTWYESCFPSKKVTTSCIHYEKSAVLFNIGALYSQIGASQSVWNTEGLKIAATNYQASVFLEKRGGELERAK